MHGSTLAGFQSVVMSGSYSSMVLIVALLGIHDHSWHPMITCSTRAARAIDRVSTPGYCGTLGQSMEAHWPDSNHHLQ